MVIIPTCSDCKNYLGGNYYTGEPSHCKAFPEEIPDNYFWSGNDDEKIIECNNGYKFEEKES